MFGERLRKLVLLKGIDHVILDPFARPVLRLKSNRIAAPAGTAQVKKFPLVMI